MKNKIIYILIALALLAIIVSVSFYSEQIPPTFATGKLRFFLFYLSAFFIVMLPAIFPWGQEGYYRFKPKSSIDSWEKMISLSTTMPITDQWPDSAKAELNRLHNILIEQIFAYWKAKAEFLKRLDKDLSEAGYRQFANKAWITLIRQKDDLLETIFAIERIPLDIKMGKFPLATTDKPTPSGDENGTTPASYQ